MSATVSFGIGSDVGVVREENQDCVGKFPDDTVDFSTPQGLLFVVADGMGGHRGGRMASQLAVKVIGERFFSSENTGTVADRLLAAVTAANKHIYEYSLDQPELNGMGTTCVTLALHQSGVCIAHVGDSRIYRVSNRKITQLTNDHSRVAEMERRGILTKEEALVHPERSQLYRALGVRAEVEVDVADGVDFRRGDYFVLCTDGLSNMVEDDEIMDLVIKHSPQDACDSLIALANQRGGFDNITVEVVQINGSESFFDRLKNTIVR
ncbi:MAG: Stp1/IreP family PP2C-type Ser/Thr phosphatase [Bacteroidota bacterium]